ncbi:Adenosylhomocysteinase [Actinacidiphila bryophytorum]|uniref:Adenosylhomocysteinase n=1 Tax=Actinacidiphila bryophytorum TaxID=1436133 RepID=A0A9W4H262_9ACTN|nr:Adenosylhomocysteinase [Actinacidiphila bryophytorum]
MGQPPRHRDAARQPRTRRGHRVVGPRPPLTLPPRAGRPPGRHADHAGPRRTGRADQTDQARRTDRTGHKDQARRTVPAGRPTTSCPPPVRPPYD